MHLMAGHQLLVRMETRSLSAPDPAHECDFLWPVAPSPARCNTVRRTRGLERITLVW